MVEKRLGVAMKAVQKFPKMKVVNNNEGYIRKVPTIKAEQKRLSKKLRPDRKGFHIN